MIEACYALSDEQLDAEPQSSTKGSIRRTLVHLVSSQRGYFSLLTEPPQDRPRSPLEFSELLESARTSGDGLLELVGDGLRNFPKDRLQTTDGYYVEPWVVMVQVINHATEHREQISSMLSALGVTPPSLDGWSHGEVTNALVPISK